MYGRVREEALSITRESPLVARCRACTDAKDQAILVEFARQDEYEDESDAPPEDTSRAALAVAAAFADETSSEEEEAQEESFASVAADAEARFEPLEVLVLDARRGPTPARLLIH